MQLHLPLFVEPHPRVLKRFAMQLLRQTACMLCFGLALTNTHAQWNGQVFDAKTEKPLSGVTLQELGGFRFALTNEQGKFALASGKDTAKFILRSLGYQTDTVRFFPGDPTFLQLRLAPATIIAPSFELVSVRAESYQPVAQTNLSENQIDALNYGKDFPMLLDQTPSVVTHSDAGAGIGYTGLRIRGTDQTRINVTINGIPINDPESMGVFWVNMPDLSSSMNSVQIQRGVGTSAQGAGAFGASININTNEFNPKAFAAYRFDGGMFNTLRHSAEFGTGQLPGGFFVEGRLSKTNSDGFIDRSFSDLKSFFLKGGYLKENTRLRFNIFSGAEQTYQAWYGVPEAIWKDQPQFNSAGTDFGLRDQPYANETDNYQQDHYQLFLDQKLSSELEMHLAAFYTRGRGYYEQYKVDQDITAYQMPPLLVGQDTLSQSDLIRQLWLDNHYVGGQASLNWQRKAWELTGGTGLYYYQNDHYGEVIWAEIAQDSPPGTRYYDQNADKLEYNGFFRAQYGAGKKWLLFADMQLRGLRYRIFGFPDNPNIQVDESFLFPNPKLGFTFNPSPKHRINAYYGIAHKEPNRVDYENSAANLPRAEVLRDLELSYRFQSSKFQLQGGFFWMDYTDQLVLTGQVNDVGAYTRTNADRSYRLGLELEAAWQMLPWMSLQVNGTWSRNRILNFTEFIDDFDNGGQQQRFLGETPIAFSPEWLAAATLELKPIKGWSMQWRHKYVGSQFLDNTGLNNRRLDPFYTADFLTNYQLPLKGPLVCRLNLGVYNMFNALYAPNGYTFSYFLNQELVTENYLYPQAGIHLMGGIQLRWEAQ